MTDRTDPTDVDLPRIPAHVRITGSGRDMLAARLREVYERGVSIQDIATELGRSYGFVHQLLREAEARLRARGGAQRQRTTRPAASPELRST